MGECNLVNVATVVGKTYSTVLQSSGLVQDGVTHNVSSGNETWLVKSLIIANRSSNSTDNQVTVLTKNGSTTSVIIKNVWIPYGTSLVVIDEATPIYLQYQDYVDVQVQQGSNIECVFKYETLRE